MIEIQNLSKTFPVSGGTVEALKDISLTIPDGEIYGIIGMSGAGKSTLVRCINMLERPTSGKVIIDGKDLGSLTQAQLREERRNITMIFQGFNLLMQRNCLKNVCFPLELAGYKKKEAVERATELLELVGLGEKLKSYPAQLSDVYKRQNLYIATAEPNTFENGIAILNKLAYATQITIGQAFDIEGAVTIVTNDAKVYIPMEEVVDKKAELARLNKELETAKKQFAQVNGKLNNQGFLSKAPAQVVEGVKKDFETLTERIQLIESSISALQS